MEKLKQNMASIVTLIAMIGAIGGGFIKYGEITTKLSQLEAREYTVVQTVDLDPVHTRINELTTKVNTNYDSLNEKINTNYNSMSTVHAELSSGILDNKSNQLILKAENDLFSNRLDEMYIRNSNPLIQ
jgi:tetrahydromethanopterin S-methyltransferase subunit B